MSNEDTPGEDALDHIVQQWQLERPDLVEATHSLQVLGRIQRMQAVYEKHYKKLLDEFGVNMGEFDVLATLRRSGPPYTLTAGALLRSSMVTSGAITNRIDRMEAKGLVERSRDVVDRRAVYIHLTEKGKVLADDAMAAHLRDYDAILSPLSPTECQQLASGLKKILEAQSDTKLS